MIQKTSQRQLNAALGNPQRPTVDGPAEWGQWVRNKHYSLEVSQHPIRARMCGFGDKDRRPLAPAAVAKMIVRREDNSILDVDDVDVDFFVVTVDLWSGDGTQEMNLVLHPSSADRYVPAHVVKSRRKSSVASTPALTTSRPTPRPSPYPAPTERPRHPTNHPPNITLRPIEPSVRISRHPPPDARGASLTSLSPPTDSSLLTPAPTPAFGAAFPFPSPSDPFPDAASPWSYPDRTPFQAPTLPSIHSLGQASPAVPETPFSAADTPDFRAWTDSSSASLFDPDPRWSAEPFALPTLPAAEPWPPVPTPPPFPTFVAPAPAPSPAAVPASSQHTIPPLPRHTYTRTLVGPLCANAQRLQDEHRKPGIFFLFQDLSIRTEGTFRLRMRLMNVGMPPAPNGLANAVHEGASPVLAQIFTEPFTVYSAKRFPGVPDTTALSIAFGNQGQKLPLRNRHGPSKSLRRPRRLGQSSDDDSS